jgi:hypothetical protein
MPPFLALFLSEDIDLAVLASDAPRLQTRGESFVDTNEEASDSMFLGFYDWLRTPASHQVAGVQLILHDGRETVRETLPNRDYIQWLSPDIVRIWFAEARVIDEEASVDQEFSVSRCLRSADGRVALVFDAAELSPAQLDWLRGDRTI